MHFQKNNKRGVITYQLKGSEPDGVNELDMKRTMIKHCKVAQDLYLSCIRENMQTKKGGNQYED